MQPDEYIRDRLDDQINWYSEKSQWHQRWFKRLRVIEILFATSIPFLVSYITPETGMLKLVVGAMGVAVALISGLVTLYRFQENWIEYRTMAETLKHEKFLFLTQTPPYGGGNLFPLLVERVESTISKENTNWAQLTRDHEKEKRNG